jgi:hypothetical protein
MRLFILRAVCALAISFSAVVNAEEPKLCTIDEAFDIFESKMNNSDPQGWYTYYVINDVENAFLNQAYYNSLDHYWEWNDTLSPKAWGDVVDFYIHCDGKVEEHYSCDDDC